MSMTEEEAKTKLCCGPPQILAVNRFEPWQVCLGSACMAWRWDSLPLKYSAEGEPIWAGHCGLAGTTVDRRGQAQ